MKNVIKTTIAFACIIGCGAPEGDDDQEQIGELEQGFTARVSTNFQYGTQTGTQHRRCNRTTSGQVCRIPDTKSQVWCENGSPLGYSADITAVINGFDDMSTWSFPFASIPALGTCADAFKNLSIKVQTDGCGANGTASNNITDYVCITEGTATNLTEGPGVVGSYQSRNFCEVKIDWTQLTNKGLNNTEDHNYFKHAVAHGIAQCIGLGGKTNNNAQATSENMRADVANTSLSTGETCMAQNFTTASPGQFNHTVFTCSGE